MNFQCFLYFRRSLSALLFCLPVLVGLLPFTHFCENPECLTGFLSVLFLLLQYLEVEDRYLAWNGLPQSWPLHVLVGAAAWPHRAFSQPQPLCQISSVVQPGLVHDHPQFSAQTSGCCSLIEGISQVPYRICPKIWFSHFLVGATAQPDMAHPLLLHSQANTVAEPNQACPVAPVFACASVYQVMLFSPAQVSYIGRYLGLTQTCSLVCPSKRPCLSDLPTCKCSGPVSGSLQKSFLLPNMPSAFPTSVNPQTPFPGNLQLPCLGARVACPGPAFPTFPTYFF